MLGFALYNNQETKDKQKGNVFSKLSRLITLTVVEGGGISDPENNIKLRLAVEKAKRFNLPKYNIDRAIEKGIGPDGLQLKALIFEAFAPGGISLIILATSDNVNRTLSEIRNVVESHGGKMGNKGSVMYLFKKCGLVTFKVGEARYQTVPGDARYSTVPGETEEEAVLSFADKIGAFDIDEDEKYFYVYLPYESLRKVKEYLGGLRADSVEVDYKPNSLVEISDEKLVKKILDFIEALDNLDDVQRVFANDKIH